MPGRWIPLLTGDARTKAAAIAQSIAGELETATRAWAPPDAARDERAVRNLSLAWGAAGLLPLFAYCTSGAVQSRMLDKQGKRVAVGLARHPLPPTLFRGFWGIGWAYAHMENSGAWEDSAGSELDDAVAPALNWMMEQHAYDLIRGLAGVGVYALEHPSQSKGAAVLRAVISALEAAGVSSDDGVFWPGVDGRTELGMAHGCAGIIAFLAAATRRERTPATVGLLGRAVSWLLAQRLTPGRGSIFPLSVDDSSEPSTSGLAWCVGDLGIAVALALAADADGRDDWRQEALHVALHAAGRPASHATGDTSLCHGSAGIAHMFSRLYQYLEHPDLREAALQWYERCLASERRGRFLGFGAPRTAQSRQHDPGFLMGAAGVALALTAATNERAPAWDRVLLLSTA